MDRPNTSSSLLLSIILVILIIFPLNCYSEGNNNNNINNDNINNNNNNNININTNNNGNSNNNNINNNNNGNGNDNSNSINNNNNGNSNISNNNNNIDNNTNSNSNNSNTNNNKNGNNNSNNSNNRNNNGNNNNINNNSNSSSNNNNNNNNNRKIKGMFVFGSSLVDNGDNPYRATVVKMNTLPYGIDFPEGPTGRFTNGKTVIDILSEYLNISHFIPPFYDPSTRRTNMVDGVNFASGGSGILDKTGSKLGDVTDLNTQIKNFVARTLPALRVELGAKPEQFLKNYMFVIGVGGNDYTSNYFANPIKQTVEQFTKNLIQILSLHIKNLYKFGGRKFVFISAYPLGCYPVNRDDQKKCNQTLNNAANIYNSHLKAMVDDLQQQMSGSHLVLVYPYKIVSDLIDNPDPQRFRDTTNACCEGIPSPTGKKLSACLLMGRVCKDRKQFMFFDGIHPTEAVNNIIASKAFNSNLQSEVYPINIKQLSNL